MRRNLIFFSVFGLLCAGVVLTFVWQRQTNESLRAELEALRDQEREHARLMGDHVRLQAAQISATELEALRSDHIALERMRAEVAAAKQRAVERKQAEVMKTAASAEPNPYEPSIMDGPMPVSMWKNAGSATPAAAVETALWAAAGGDVDRLAHMLVFAPGAREKAQALLAELPGAMRADFDSPEKLVASLGAKDVPLTSARLIDPKMQDGNETRIVAQLSGSKAGENPRTVLLSLREADGSWKLVVPTKAIEKYRAMLKGAGEK